jgi:hypothetical protein
LRVAALLIVCSCWYLWSNVVKVAPELPKPSDFSFHAAAARAILSGQTQYVDINYDYPPFGGVSRNSPHAVRLHQRGWSPVQASITSTLPRRDQLTSVIARAIILLVGASLVITISFPPEERMPLQHPPSPGLTTNFFSILASPSFSMNSSGERLGPPSGGPS